MTQLDVNVYTSLFPDVLRVTACIHSLWKHYLSIHIFLFVETLHQWVLTCISYYTFRSFLTFGRFWWVRCLHMQDQRLLMAEWVPYNKALNNSFPKSYILFHKHTCVWSGETHDITFPSGNHLLQSDWLYITWKGGH